KDFWLTGSGVGGFYSIFPSYRDNRSQSFYDFAHNDYLQLWIEYGLIGLSLFGLIVILSFIKALKAQQHRHTAILKGMGFAAMMAIISSMIHATTEFNFHIPANALLFTLICAIACISADMENQEHEPKRRRKHSVPSTKA
ncbi:MAG TPA: O-antigen ligase family protein, partial [Agitococcus sp.]|nr:O-antigen ligase family protein [Agitococcus sp.]